ncbi:MAG: LEA type 2 family protein [Alistipes sp.]|jgi:hypothetical protein|nr:LEA type 2 family protein [Alistipes sp.]
MKKLLYLVELVAVIVVTAALTTTLTGCNPAAKVSLIEVGQPTITGLTRVSGEATARNDGQRDFTIESARFTVCYDDRELASAVLTRPVTIPAGGAIAHVWWELELENVSLTGLMSVQERLRRDPEGLTVDVEARIGRRKIEKRGIPLARITDFLEN